MHEESVVVAFSHRMLCYWSKQTGASIFCEAIYHKTLPFLFKSLTAKSTWSVKEQFVCTLAVKRCGKLTRKCVMLCIVILYEERKGFVDLHETQGRFPRSLGKFSFKLFLMLEESDVDRGRID